LSRAPAKKVPAQKGKGPAKAKAKAPSKRAAGGRPTKYRVDFARQAQLLATKGCTDAEAAEFFGVAVSTLNLWKLQHQEFSEALKMGKAVADARVERALFERATGYTCKETDIRVVNGELVITPMQKHYPPDTTAMIFWLKNRQRELWRDKPEPADDETPPPTAVEVRVVSGRKRANP